MTNFRSEAQEAGWHAGYDTANYVTAYGGTIELSYYRYKEADGPRWDYDSGWELGVDAFEADYEEEN